MTCHARGPAMSILTGAIKYLGSIRGVLERASARETAVRVAAGAVARLLLSEFDIQVLGYVVELGGLRLEPPAGTLDQLRMLRDASEVYSLCPDRDADVKELIDQTGKQGDTLGGIVETRVEGLPMGLGSHAQWDQKLDGRVAQAVMSIQAIKGVEIGLGFEAARHVGSLVHDPIEYDASQKSSVTLGYQRPTNNAGGLEAGITNGQPLILRAAKKPISTLRKPLASIDMTTKQPQEASYERSDVCAVPAASVIVENVVAFEVARAVAEKFGNDSLVEMKARWQVYHDLASQR